MSMAKHTLLSLIVAAGVLFPGRVLADRAPTADERSRIEATLRNEGFSRWGEIEFDGGVWEVDDAHASDGRKYDLKLHRDAFAVIEREPD